MECILKKFIGIVVVVMIIGAPTLDQSFDPSGSVVATATAPASDCLSAFGPYAAVRLDRYDFRYLSSISYSRQPSS